MLLRGSFDRQLRALGDEVLAMGDMVDKALARSMEALKSRDLKLAQQVIDDDALIDKKRMEIESQGVQLIVTQQPVASDLRIILSALYIAVDMERIADHAEGTARIAVMIGNEPPLKPLIDLPRMTDMVRDMLRRALDALVRRDAQCVRAITTEDDNIDNLYDQVYRELLTFMLEDPRTITRATRLIWAAHNLERSADHVTNICERVAFIVTGSFEEMRTSKY